MYLFYAKKDYQIVPFNSHEKHQLLKNAHIAFQNQLRRHLILHGIYCFGETETEFILPRSYLQTTLLNYYQKEQQLLLTLVPKTATTAATTAIDTAPTANILNEEMLPKDLFIIPPQMDIVQSLLFHTKVENKKCGFLILPKDYGHIVILCHYINQLKEMNKILIITHNAKRQTKWMPFLTNPDHHLIECNSIPSSGTEFLDLIILDDMNKMKNVHEWFIKISAKAQIIAFSNLPVSNGTLFHFVEPFVFYQTKQNEKELWISSMNSNCNSSSSNSGSSSSSSNDDDILSNMYLKRKSQLSTSSEIDSICTMLRMQPRVVMKKKPSSASSSSSKKDNSIFNAYMESNEFLHVPRFFYSDRYTTSGRFITKVSEGTLLNENAVSFHATLKSYQIDAANIVLNRMRTSISSGSIICLPCGKGKTITALSIVSSSRKKTIILVHNTDLLDQWKDRIAVFLPNARIGIIQQDIFQVADYDITIALLQSIALRSDYPEEQMQTFGLCIVDECHRIGCRFFSTAVAKIFAAHIVGLSATPRRKDGLESLMHYSLGPVVYELKREFIQVRVVMINYVPQKVRVRELPYGRSRMLSELAEEKARNQVLLRIASFLVHVKNRCIIILSERTQQLEQMLLDLTREPFNVDISMIGLSIGKIKRPRRQEIYSNEQYRIILTTYQLAREALDVPRLDTLIMATPTSDVVQAIGRILREYPNKKVPLVLDIADILEGFLSSTNTRKRYYKKEGYQIQKFQNVDQYFMEMMNKQK
jgi:superfamily II DNA or RNA helicase